MDMLENNALNGELYNKLKSEGKTILFLYEKNKPIHLTMHSVANIGSKYLIECTIDGSDEPKYVFAHSINLSMLKELLDGFLLDKKFEYRITNNNKYKLIDRNGRKWIDLKDKEDPDALHVRSKYIERKIRTSGPISVYWYESYKNNPIPVYKYYEIEAEIYMTLPRRYSFIQYNNTI